MNSSPWAELSDLPGGGPPARTVAPGSEAGRAPGGGAPGGGGDLRRAVGRSLGFRAWKSHSPKKFPVNSPPSQPAVPFSQASADFGFRLRPAGLPRAGFRRSFLPPILLPASSSSFTSEAFALFCALAPGILGLVRFRCRFGAFGRFFGRRPWFRHRPAAADFDHLDRRLRLVARVFVAGAADQEADADRQDQRRDAGDQGGVGVHASGGLPAPSGGGGRGGAPAPPGSDHRLHEDDGVHEGQARLAAAVAAVEAVALVGRHPRAAVGAGVVAAEGGHRRRDRRLGGLLGRRRGRSRRCRLGLLGTGTHRAIFRGRPPGGV